ncbi:hypothetical protein NDU88_000793 [Pleurodeles waltl]|uniref:Uncharacterized protein n=1 Tax=Pleurodeles waltl TaxID=8319 RepID=A0AAV7WGH9_PLEWA|nr:hypothetical protein NDU88_000793 [Pleurodeles waltl]
MGRDMNTAINTDIDQSGGQEARGWEEPLARFTAAPGLVYIGELITHGHAVIRGQAQAIIEAKTKDTKLTCANSEKDIMKLSEIAQTMNAREDKHELQLRQQDLRA